MGGCGNLQISSFERSEEKEPIVKRCVNTKFIWSVLEPRLSFAFCLLHKNELIFFPHKQRRPLFCKTLFVAKKLLPMAPITKKQAEKHSCQPRKGAVLRPKMRAQNEQNQSNAKLNRNFSLCFLAFKKATHRAPLLLEDSKIFSILLAWFCELSFPYFFFYVFLNKLLLHFLFTVLLRCIASVVECRFNSKFFFHISMYPTYPSHKILMEK